MSALLVPDPRIDTREKARAWLDRPMLCIGCDTTPLTQFMGWTDDGRFLCPDCQPR